jgi:hypothetical protein
MAETQDPIEEYLRLKQEEEGAAQGAQNPNAPIITGEKDDQLAAAAAQEAAAQEAAAQQAAAGQEAAAGQQMSPEEMAAAQAAAAGQQAPPGPDSVPNIEELTGGKFKSVDELMQVLGQQQQDPREKQIVELYKQYGPDAYRILSLADTNVDEMGIDHVLMDVFAKNNPNLSPEAIQDGWLVELKKELGDPNLLIDFDLEGYGLSPYYKEKFDGLAQSKKNELSEFYKGLVPALSEFAGNTGSQQMRGLSEEDRKNFQDEVNSFTKYQINFAGDDSLEVPIDEIEGFRDRAQEIISDPQAYLEKKFMKAGPDGKPASLDIQKILQLEALEATLPKLLEQYGQRIGERRYADGMAEGSGKSVEDLRKNLGLTKGDSNAKSEEELRKEAVRSKADEFYKQLNPMVGL